MISPTPNIDCPRAVLFDLDGTLLDSAPDFSAVIARMRAARGLPELGLETIRPVVSKGGLTMLEYGFPHYSPAECKALLPEFLQIYQSLIGQYARLFDGVALLLENLEKQNIPWGIITNKPEYLARLILPQHAWETRCQLLIGGDTLEQRKPHPLPLLEAAKQLGLKPQDCIYVGDDERDIQAARAATMASVVALWGYRPADTDPHTWQADYLYSHPDDFWHWLYTSKKPSSSNQ